jgi:transposase-like protein
MADEGVRLFSREFKLAALARMEAGENVSALARELGVKRKYLYQWRERFRAGGPIALRMRGRPTTAEVLAMRSGDCASLSEPVTRMPALVPADDLTLAQRRIAELERKVGQQQVDLDFFQQALRQVREARRLSGAPGAPASTRSSKE